MKFLEVMVFVISVGVSSAADDLDEVCDTNQDLGPSGQLVVTYRASGGTDPIEVTPSGLRVGDQSLPADTVLPINIFKDKNSGSRAPDVQFDKADPVSIHTVCPKKKLQSDFPHQ